MNLVKLKKKIKTIKNIHNVVHSMETLATMKIMQVRKQAELRKSYFRELEDILFSFLSIVPHDITQNVLLTPTKMKNPLLVVVTSDRGFCGNMNQQVIGLSRTYLRNNISSVISIGKRAGNIFIKEDFPVIAMISQSLEKVNLHFTQSLASDIIRGFLNQEYDSVFFCYMQFKNLISQKPVIKQILPIIKTSDDNYALRYNYEFVYLLPSPKEVFSKLVRKYMDAVIYSLLLDAAASEQAMRMISMKSATENAEEMVQDMQKKYQKIRQERITLELIELHNEQKVFEEV